MKRIFRIAFKPLALLFVIIFAASCSRETVQVNRILQEKSNRSMATAQKDYSSSAISVSSTEGFALTEEEAEAAYRRDYSADAVKGMTPSVNKQKIDKSYKPTLAEKAALAVAKRKIKKMEKRGELKELKELKAADKTNVDINHYMKLGLIFILIGFLVGILFGNLGYLLAVVGVIILLYGLILEL